MLNYSHVIMFSHCFHVVLWLQGDLEDFGAVDDLLKAGGRDCLASDAVHLIKGVGLEDALISRTNEDLQAERLLASVAMQLHTRKSQKNRLFLGDETEIQYDGDVWVSWLCFPTSGLF